LAWELRPEATDDCRGACRSSELLLFLDAECPAVRELTRLLLLKKAGRCVYFGDIGKDSNVISSIRYFLNPLTALPLVTTTRQYCLTCNSPIPGRPQENLMSWAKAARRRKKNDVECGFSSCVRNIILVGSLLDDEGPSWRSHPSQRGSIQPSSSIIKPSPALSDHNQADPLRPASLSRRPTVRLPAYLSLDRRRSHHGGPTKTEIPGDSRVECAGEGVRNGLKHARAAR